MSQLLRTIIGGVIPEIPLQDEVPVPYRPVAPEPEPPPVPPPEPEPPA